MAKKFEIKKKGVAVIKLKLGTCMSGPTYRMLEDLEAVALRCNVVRNWMIRYWERWHEDNPGFQPSKVISKRGKDYQETGLGSYEMLYQMYHLAMDKFPSIYSGIVSELKNEVIKRLKLPTPYDHPFDSMYRWQAILRNEVSKDTFRSLHIPVLNNVSIFCYEGDCSRDLSPGIKKRVVEHGKSSAVIRFPLFSSKAGRKVLDVIVRVEVGQMSEGHRDILRKIAKNQDGYKFGDSQLVKDGKNWFLHMVYERPAKNFALDVDRVATLIPCQADDTHPLSISTPDRKAWKLGRVKGLLREWQRFDARKKSLRDRYREDSGLQRGRGRCKVFNVIKPVNRLFTGLQRQFLEGMVSEVVRYVVRNKCGTLYYREPTKPVREVCWFSENDLSFDWTGFLAKLRHKMTSMNVNLVEERIWMKEYKGVEKEEKDVG